MGKLRFKLSHVMPHVWFYKLKDIGKPGNRSSHPHSKSSHLKLTTVRTAKSGSSGRIYASPINHKAIDIHFPETPKKSPYIQSQKASELGLDKDITLPPSVDSRLSSGCTCSASVASRLRAKEMSQAAWTTRSPSVWSDGADAARQRPRPSVSYNPNTVDSEGEERVHDNSCDSEGKAEWGNGVCLDVRELERKLKALGPQDRRKYYSSPEFSAGLPSPVLDGASQESLDLLDYSFGNSYGEDENSTARVVYDEWKLLVDGGRSSHASTSYRHSTSSSDTGFERASSSMWDKDISSFTSEGSDLFTTIDEIDSPLLKGLSRSSRRPKEKKQLLSTAVKASESPFPHGTGGYLHKYHSNSSRFTSKNKERAARTSSGNMLESYPDGRTDHSLRYCQQAQVEQPTHHQLKSGECSLPLVKYESDHHQKSQHRRGLSNEFSYSESKDRLLSGRLSFEQASDFALSESEVETLSKNYNRYKLQRSGSSARGSNVTKENSRVTPDPGLFKLSRIQHAEPEAPALKEEEFSLSRSSSRNSSRNCSRRPSTDNRGSLHNVGEVPSAGRMGNVEGPSWYKGTLRVVKEKRREQSLQELSAKAHSKVLDSFAMVKCSYDPRQDFKDSMLEMILEKELHRSGDLVELLQCYLSLNSEKYHDTIVKVFGEVWSELFQSV